MHAPLFHSLLQAALRPSPRRNGPGVTDPHIARDIGLLPVDRANPADQR
ncbi:hypothetical protein [Actibacterium mucosum]|nr:hypothetical protein [Actibacterium mucosum]